MAESARAHAQSRSASTSPNLASPTLDDLALQTCDDADTLHEVMHAYTALEKLVDTAALNDSEVLATNRTELSALLRLLNEALMARIGTVNSAAAALREALLLQAQAAPTPA
ncbi:MULTISPECIES: hypothetical protein [unclassified Variovorax]|uniref:hypothetical protein n=1 Tax=unclassified Variovorax TaxID=663243 RepID=UPI0008C743E7|nr:MULTISPECIES: hypothetical protein [unclassified Variovorax]SEI97572.1 hypothetical protein SAMN05518853_101240 [Variovorax sp. OK202]SFB88256.1 hypothetical protein SAMN05444746_101240 [Variovorax sp. OK212]